MPRAKPSLSYIKSYDADRENVEAARSCTSVPWHSDSIRFCQWHLGSAITQTQLRIVIQYVSIKMINLANVYLIWKVLFMHILAVKHCLSYQWEKLMWKWKQEKKTVYLMGRRTIFTSLPLFSVSLPALRNRTGLSPEQDFRICFDTTYMYKILWSI